MAVSEFWASERISADEFEDLANADSCWRAIAYAAEQVAWALAGLADELDAGSFDMPAQVSR